MTSAGLAGAGEASIASMMALGGEGGVSGALDAGAAKIASGKTSNKTAARWRRTTCMGNSVILRGLAKRGAWKGTTLL